jgi:hypothetical protein
MRQGRQLRVGVRVEFRDERGDVVVLALRAVPVAPLVTRLAAAGKRGVLAVVNEADGRVVVRVPIPPDASLAAD